jgi:uncharacterized cupredoxin-like copper-binding protein
MLMTSIAVVALIVSACASGGESETEPLTGVDRIVTISMRDNHFEPDDLTVEEGETIGFRFVNRGRVDHDAFIGDQEAQDEHEKEMRMMEEDHGEHSTEDTGGIVVEPGESGTLKHRFAEDGTLEIGCHQPGHYADRMIAKHHRPVSSSLNVTGEDALATDALKVAS